MPEKNKRYTPPTTPPTPEQLAGQQEQMAEKGAEEASPEELAQRLKEAEAESKGPAPQRVFGQDGRLYEAPADPSLPPTVLAPEGAKAGVVTAFLIIQERDGRIWATNDLNVVERIEPDRQATTFDMVPGCSQVISDVEMMKTVQNTVNAMMQTSQAMMEHQRNQQVAAKLASKGIHLPGR